jgi:hypothetical protein
MKAKFTVTAITNKRNGYNMPIVEVKSDSNIKVVNRGYNEFECLQDIDESELLPLRDQLPSEEIIMLEVTTPESNTTAWYKLRNRNGYPLKETNNLIF